MVDLEHLEWLSKRSRKELYEILEKALAELKPIELLEKQAEENRQKANNVREEGEKSRKGIYLFIGYSILLLYPLGILIRRLYKKKLGKMEEKVNQQVNAILTVCKQCETNAQEQRVSAMFLLAVPKGYCYSLAIETMIDIIANGRANTWQELADRYEEQYHRWTLEENSSEMLETQIRQAQATEETLQQARKAANWAAIGAIGSWTTAAGVWRINSKL